MNEQIDMLGFLTRILTLFGENKGGGLGRQGSNHVSTVGKVEK